MITAQALKELLQQHKVIPIKLGEQRLLLTAEGVLLWPQHDLLIFSDLHLEKGSFLSQFANPIPRFDSRNTLERMQYCVKLYQCKWVVCLGDSLHDTNALKRMATSDLLALNDLVNTLQKWTWVQGNHDPEIPREVLGERTANIVLENLLFTHEPENLEEYASVNAQIVGHYHPKTSVKLANRRVRGKSFLLDDTILIMPAFGKYTGGLDCKDPVFSSLISANSRSRYLVYNHRIYKV